MRARSSGVACLSLLVACGGGGGGGGGPDTLLHGDYHVVGFRGAGASPSDTLTSLWGSGAFDGHAAFTDGGGTQNANGTVTTFPGGSVVPYGVNATGDLFIPGLGGTEAWHGGFSPDGALAALGGVFPSPGADAAADFFVRKQVGASAASLSGPYHACSLGLNYSTDEHIGAVGGITFDGLGGLSELPGIVRNVDGVLLTPSGIGSGTYGVAADGALSLDGHFDGAVLATGELAIVGGGNAPFDFSSLSAFVRQSSSASVATLVGTYSVVGVSWSVTSSRYADFAGTLTADGTGHGQTILNISVDGVVSFDTNVITYTVASDGTLTITVPGAAEVVSTLLGAVSESGKVGILGGGSTAGSDPSLWVLIQR